MLTHNQVPKGELDARLAALRAALSDRDPAWEMVLINNKISLYYLTGTMQDGVLVITPDAATFWVRRYFPRAQAESLFADIRPMKSFRVLEGSYSVPNAAYVECKTASLEWLGLLRKYLPFASYKNISPLLADLRAHKSAYELDCMRRAGAIHAEVIEQVTPGLIRSGVSEAVLCAEIYRALLARGAMGISRFNQLLGEDVAGLCAFSENGLRITAFDGPDGNAGTCIAMPAIGDNRRLLREGDLILLDIPSGLDGYHTDKSAVYFYGDLDRHPAADRIRAHRLRRPLVPHPPRAPDRRAPGARRHPRGDLPLAVAHRPRGVRRGLYERRQVPGPLHRPGHGRKPGHRPRLPRPARAGHDLCLRAQDRPARRGRGRNRKHL